MQNVTSVEIPRALSVCSICVAAAARNKHSGRWQTVQVTDCFLKPNLRGLLSTNLCRRPTCQRRTLRNQSSPSHPLRSKSEPFTPCGARDCLLQLFTGSLPTACSGNCSEFTLACLGLSTPRFARARYKLFLHFGLNISNVF